MIKIRDSRRVIDALPILAKPWKYAGTIIFALVIATGGPWDATPSNPLSNGLTGVGHAQESAEEPASDAESPEESDSSSKESKSKSDIKKHAVKAESLKVAFELEAVVESPSIQPITLRPKTLKELKLVNAAAHGQRVSQGQTVLQLEVEAWDRARRSAEQAFAAAQLEFDQAKRQLASIEESYRLELEASELSERQAREELAYFLEQGKAQQIESQEQSLKNSERSLEYTREEYDQLKKMYDADEITEETEEIVLRRAKHDLERAEYFLKTTRTRVQRALEVELPRQEANMKNAAARSKLELERLQLSKAQRMESAKLQAAKAETSAESAHRELAQLKEDREMLNWVAQFQGILYYGAIDRGQWKGGTAIEELMIPGGSLPASRTLMTIVGSEKLFVRAKLPERWLLTLKPGMSASLELTAGGGNRIQVECDDVDEVPIDPGQYRASFRFTRPSDAADLLPLMAGKIHLVVYEKENALMVPTDAVHYDQATPYVTTVDESGQQRRQNVSLGHRDDKRIEIVQGVREGEYVVLP